MEGVAVTVRKEHVTKLTKPAYSLLEDLTTKVSVVKGALCFKMQKTKMTKEIGRDRKTLNKYLGELSDEKLIIEETKRGRNGGTLIVVKKEAVRFENGENIINSPVKMEELRDYFFPKEDKPEPTKKYRSKEEILRERMFMSEAKREESRLNTILRENRFPTRSFFEQTAEPLLYTRAYLLSRLYNAFVVIYPNDRKDHYESVGDEQGFNRSMAQLNKYKDYDCLDKEFIGTPNYNHFIKLAKVLDVAKMDPVDYLTSQFNFMNYLELTGTRRVGLPFINTLWGEEAYNRHLKNYVFWKDHYVKHPYYKPGFDILKSQVWKYPIVTTLSDLYKDPFKYKEQDTYQDVIDTVAQMGYTPNKTKLVINFCEDLLENAAESDLETHEKEVLTNFIKQQYAVNLGHNRLSAATYVTTFPYQIMERIMQENLKGIEDFRAYCASLGNMGNIREYGINDKQTFTRRGYFYDFSFTANESFPMAIMTANSLRYLDDKTAGVAEAIEKFGEAKIPLTSYGMLDLDTLYATYLTDEQLQDDIEGYKLFHSSDRVLDNKTNLWYDLVDTKVGDAYQRDGRAIYR